MGNEKNGDRLGKRVADLDKKVADLAMGQKRIDYQLRVKDNWHSETKNWVGKEVRVFLRDGSYVEGRLKWSDKYQIAVVVEGHETNDPDIINKGAIVRIRLARRPSHGQ